MMKDKSTPPLARLVLMLKEDRREFASILVYSFLNSLILLVIPLAAQALVNVVVAGLYLQPLIILTGALMGGLVFAGLLTVVRFVLVEVMRERIFARVALRVAERLPRVCHRSLSENNGPELMNRFFDVVNVQKSWFKLAYDGPGAILEISVGLCLLALYGPELTVIGASFLLFGALTLLLAGWNGLKTSVEESGKKYRVVEWLEEMVRCHDSMKLNSRPAYWAEEADRRVVAFLKSRRRHFRVLVRQHIVYYSLAALAVSVMLGFGGYLVVQGQLTLGQLVAAELVVWSILKASEKLLRSLEAYYDLLTGLEKVSVITSMPLEARGNATILPDSAPARVLLDDLTFRYGPEAENILNGIQLEVKPGEVVTILGESNSGKTTLMKLIAGFLPPAKGCIELDQVDVREFDESSLARNLAFLSGSSDLFGGTLLENIATGRKCDLSQARSLLETFGGRSILSQFPGTGNDMVSGGTNLSASQREILLLTRALVEKPRLLLIDDALMTLSENLRAEVVRKLRELTSKCTIISTVPLPELVAFSDRICLLEGGRIEELGTPGEALKKPRCKERFPTLCLLLKNLLRAEKN